MTDRRSLSSPRVVSPDARFRILRSGEVEVSVAGRTFEIPMSVHHLMLEFVEPRAPEDVHRALDTELDVAELGELIALLDDHGVLVAPDADDEPDDGSFTRAIAQGALGAPEVSAAVAASLAAGRAVTISDALAPDFAEEVYADLTQLRHWHAYEGAHGPYAFHYRQHHVFDASLYPPALRRCTQLFGSNAAKRFMTTLSGVDCTGDVQVGASLYLPGDFSLPHTDVSFPKSVSFVLHLTKDWEPAWGGGLFWCPTGIQVMPAFNRLTIFNVTPTSSHFVAPVSNHARGRRLAVNGWWTQRASHAPEPRKPSPLPDGFVGPCYGAQPQTLAGDRRIVIL